MTDFVAVRLLSVLLDEVIKGVSRWLLICFLYNFKNNRQSSDNALATLLTGL